MLCCQGRGLGRFFLAIVAFGVFLLFPLLAVTALGAPESDSSVAIIEALAIQML